MDANVANVANVVYHLSNIAAVSLILFYRDQYDE